MRRDPFKEFALGCVRLHILHHAARGPVFGKAFRDELKRHGYDLSFGTLYPIFYRLEAEGYLQSESRPVEGRTHRFYRITALGRAALDEGRRRVHELLAELEEA